MLTPTQLHSAVLLGRDEVHLSIATSGDDIVVFTLQGVGCLDFLRKLAEIRQILSSKKKLSEWNLPAENDHSSMLLREVILKAKGEWKFPYPHDELCHCRAIPTKVVDAAVVCGAHRVDDVRRQTSAGTACGTCKPDIESVIKYRLA